MVSELTTCWSPRPSTCWRHACARRCRSSNNLTLALETGFQASEKPITEAIADSVLSKQIDGVEATLNRNGYTTKVLTEMLGVKAGELRGWLLWRWLLVLAIADTSDAWSASWTWRSL